MQIVKKRSHSECSDDLFIFEFVDTTDMRLYIDGIKDYINNKCPHESLKNRIFRILDILEQRTDSKYARDGAALSGLLFSSEMCEFTMVLSFVVSMKQ